MSKHKWTIAGAFGVLVVAAALAAGGGKASAATAAFTDPAGDAKGAPDISAVNVRDTPASGTITVSVTAAGFVPGTSIDVWLDTDKNGSTGSASGSEYTLDVWQDPDDWGWTIERWTGSTWADVPETPSMRFSRSGDVFTWTVAKADLGGTAGFGFWVGGYLIQGDDVVALDEAPDGGTWGYELTAVPAQAVKAVVGRPLAVPARARAGKLLSVAFPVTRSDNGAPFTGGTLKATTTIGAAVVPSTASFSNGTASVNVLVPKKAKGKVLTVTVQVSAGAQTTKRTATFPIS